MKVGLFFDCGQPLLEISVHSFLNIQNEMLSEHAGIHFQLKQVGLVFIRDFPDFVEIYTVCQLSVPPGISFISSSIGSYVELAIFREDVLSVASVNVRFPGMFYFVLRWLPTFSTV